MASSFLLRYRACALLIVGLLLAVVPHFAAARTIRGSREDAAPRERTSLNAGWKFSRFTTNPDSLSYDVLKAWILPSANDFITNGTKYERPSSTPPGSDVKYIQDKFDDSTWEAIDLPHDWAVKGPFNAPGISGGMGRLPTNGVGWYRRTVTLAKQDFEKIYLDVDGAMSYAAVWLNGKLVGGWPFGYNSFRLDLTPYAKEGANQLAIRLDNKVDSSRWYPGAGIYRNVWLVKVNPVHVRQYGTYITTPKVSTESATVDLVVEVDNTGSGSKDIQIETTIHQANSGTGKPKKKAVASFPSKSISLKSGAKGSVSTSVEIKKPQLWGPPPTQKPNLYVAVTTVKVGETTVDTYETRFGVRSLTYDPNKGLLVNGEHVYVKGVCLHHDLGSIGAAFNTRAAERQFEIIREYGTNAIRTSHNPPAPEQLELADRLGFLVYDEIFDAWNRKKTTNDFTLIFPEWHEPDLRSFIRRDRNHPSVIAWGFGNEIPEQREAAGATTGRSLRTIIRSEDSTRPVTTGMDRASGTDPLSSVVDLLGLNYQGEGRGAVTDSSFPGFHAAQPNKMLWSSESSSTVSSRGKYFFPITSSNSAIVGSGGGTNDTIRHVSAYELYAPSWAASPDKVFLGQDKHPYVAGEFVWTGFDYIGEPTPYDSYSRSSYFGIVDMAGFKKDRFYLYQARWRPDLPSAHILPHWNWPDRVGKVTPVHVFSSGDEAELFVNGKSAGRKKKAEFDYRFRWDDVKYEAGDLRVVTYKGGKEWATDTKRTVGVAKELKITADRAEIAGDGNDLSFVSVAVVDAKGDVVPTADNLITFSITGPGKIVSTDNGDPTDFTVFPSSSRKAFSGQLLSIIRADAGARGAIVVTASSPGLPEISVTLRAR